MWKPLLRVSSRIYSLREHHEKYIWGKFPPLQENEYLCSELRVLELSYKQNSQSTWPPLLSTSLPHLHTLTTRRADVLNLRPLLTGSPSLRSLTLHLHYYGWKWPVFFRAVGQLTALEHLTLEDSFRSPPYDYKELPLVIGKVVALPSLRSLHLKSHPLSEKPAWILRNLSFPGDAFLEVAHSNPDETEGAPFWEMHEADNVRCLTTALEMRLSGRTSGVLEHPPSVLTLSLSQTFSSYGDVPMVELTGCPSTIQLSDTTPPELTMGRAPEDNPPASFLVQWFPKDKHNVDMLADELWRVQSFERVQTLVLANGLPPGFSPQSASAEVSRTCGACGRCPRAAMAWRLSWQLCDHCTQTETRFSRPFRPSVSLTTSSRPGMGRCRGSRTSPAVIPSFVTHSSGASSNACDCQSSP